MKSKQKDLVVEAPGGRTDLRTSCSAFVLEFVSSSRREAALEKIPMRHSFILRALLRYGPRAVTEIASRMSVSPATVSGMLDELFEGGLLHREHGVDDRRRVLISLTARGRRIAERLEARAAARWSELEKNLSPSDVAAANRVLSKITSELRRQNSEGTKAGRGKGVVLRRGARGEGARGDSELQ
ncbi:MAG: MarR family transcriptional regulator [Thermoplasmata archaeon]|nr:MarR family transcriptional regulator [Candidatus Sysuiplasma acidicola]